MILSIIIPVYNVGRYLDSCLDSLTRNYKNQGNVEVLLVDDGSTDNSGEICDLWSKKHSYIKVIRKKNGGLSDARNAGINEAKGKYIAFVDSDDMVCTGFIEKIIKLLDKIDADILWFSYCRFKDENDLRTINSIVSDSKELSKDGAFCLMAGDNHRRMGVANTGNFAWNKVYSTKLFKDIRYPKGKNYEDVAVTYRLIDKANKICKVNEVMYYYRENSKSIVNDRKKLKNYRDMVMNLQDQYIFFKNRNYNCVQELVKKQLFIWGMRYAHCYYNLKEEDTFFGNIEEFLLNESSVQLNFRWKIELLIFRKLRFLFILIKK